VILKLAATEDVGLLTLGAVTSPKSYDFTIVATLENFPEFDLEMT